MGMLIKEGIRFLKGDVLRFIPAGVPRCFPSPWQYLWGFFFCHFALILEQKSYICKESTYFKDKLTDHMSAETQGSLSTLWSSFSGQLLNVPVELDAMENGMQIKNGPSSVLQLNWGDKTYTPKRQNMLDCFVFRWVVRSMYGICLDPGPPEPHWRHESPSTLGELANVF